MCLKSRILISFCHEIERQRVAGGSRMRAEGLNNNRLVTSLHCYLIPLNLVFGNFVVLGYQIFRNKKYLVNTAARLLKEYKNKPELLEDKLELKVFLAPV